MTQNICSLETEGTLSAQNQAVGEIEPRDIFPTTDGYLFNAVIEYLNPQGMKFTDVCSAVPELYHDALRRVLRMRQLKRDRPRSFAVVDAYLEARRIPDFGDVQDRLDAAWSAVVGFGNRHYFRESQQDYWFPWAANQQDRRFLDHYKLRVMDSEAATEDEQMDKVIRFAESLQRQDVAVSVTYHWANAMRGAADDSDVPLSVGRQIHQMRFSGLAPC